MTEFLTALGELLLALAGAAATIWSALDIRGRIIAVTIALALFTYWFADGVKNWRRKCVPCRGAGAFNSKISTRLNRPCDCCAGSPAGGGRHPTVRKRLWMRMRGQKQY